MDAEEARVCINEEFQVFANSKKSPRLVCILIQQFVWMCRECYCPDGHQITNLWTIEDPTETEIDGMEVEVIATVSGVAMKGYIDRFIFAEDGTVVISDYKTGKIPNLKYKSEDDKFFQLLCYALMLNASEQETTSKLELLYLTQKAKHDLVVTQENLGKARSIIVKTRSEIESACEREEFRCNVTVLCNYCHYKKIGICPAHQKN
jgi:putative RecB family exonuclease